MKRRSNQTVEYVMGELGKVIACVTDHGTLTWNELRHAAVQWCKRDYDYIAELAGKLGVTPMALTQAALLYVDHPLLVKPGGGWVYGPLRAQVELIRVILYEISVEIPEEELVHKVIHTPDVKVLKDVDKYPLIHRLSTEQALVDNLSTES